MPNSQEKSCLITGAAGGIGRSLVDVFRNAGYRILAIDNAPCPENLHCDSYLRIDLARFVQDESYANESLVNIRDSLAGERLNTIINNAAIQVLGGADSLTRDDWQKTLDVNLRAPFFLTQALLPELVAAHGGVINIGSVHARLTKKNFVAYATSKAALAGMTRALAVDLGPRVRINAIEPAAIESEMLKAGFAGKPELYSQLERCHPSQCIGQPQEVANLALAIAEGGMSFLSGSCIALDGGISGRLHDPG